MFGIGMPEMLLLLAVALIVFGPKKLPELAKSLGRAMGEFKRATTEIKESIETETGIGEVRDTFKDVAKDVEDPTRMAGDVPDPTPPDPTVTDTDADTTAPESKEAADGLTEPLKKVKEAFDELNPDKGDPGEFTTTRDDSLDEDPPVDDAPDKTRDDASS